MSDNTVKHRREELESHSQIANVDKLLGQDDKWYPRTTRKNARSRKRIAHAGGGVQAGL